MAATASQTNLAGLPRRLVQDGIVSEAKLAEATEAAKKDKVPLVAYLVNEDVKQVFQHGWRWYFSPFDGEEEPGPAGALPKKQAGRP